VTSIRDLHWSMLAIEMPVVMLELYTGRCPL